MRLALPMLLQALLGDMLSIVDMVFVGKLGKEAIAAVAASGVLLSVVYTLTIGITTGCAALVAQATGAGNRARAEEVVGQGLLMGVAFAATVAALGLSLAPVVLRELTEQQAVVEAGTGYLRILSGCSFAMVLSFVFASSMRGAGDAVTPLKIMGLANLINIVLDPILIYGLCGVPALGVAGSAWASALAALIACCLMVRVFFKGAHRQFHLRLGHLRPRWHTIGRICRIGIYGSGQMLVRNISGIALVGIVSSFGAIELAAYGAGMRLWFSVLMLGIGVSNAAATLVGQNLGAGKPERASRAGWVTTGAWVAISVVAAAVLYAFASPLMSIFNTERSFVEAGTEFLRWTCLTLGYTALSVIIGGAMSGAGDTFWPMLITGLSMLALRLPLAYVLAEEWNSTQGVWAAVAASNVVQGLLFVAAFLWGRWKTVGKRLVESSRPPLPPGGE